MRKKNKVIAIRVSDDEHYIITQKAKDANKTVTDFLIDCASKKKICVIDIKPLQKEINYIGRNLNQVITLANMGRIGTVNLTEFTEELKNITSELGRIKMRCS